MAAIIHPLLTLLASLSRQELARQVTYLRAENQILRSRLPGRIQLNNQEKRKLLRQEAGGQDQGADLDRLLLDVPQMGPGDGGRGRAGQAQTGPAG
jgi:hypothetical protein